MFATYRWCIFHWIVYLYDITSDNSVWKKQRAPRITNWVVFGEVTRIFEINKENNKSVGWRKNTLEQMNKRIQWRHFDIFLMLLCMECVKQRNKNEQITWICHTFLWMSLQIVDKSWRANLRSRILIHTRSVEKWKLDESENTYTTRFILIECFRFVFDTNTTTTN